MSHYRKRYGDSFKNYSQLMKMEAIIGVSINTMTIGNWSCTVRIYEKCRKSWSTGAHVISVWNSKYICPTGSISRSKLNLESDSKMCRNGETARKNCNGMTNMLWKDIDCNSNSFSMDSLLNFHLSIFKRRADLVSSWNSSIFFFRVPIIYSQWSLCIQFQNQVDWIRLYLNHGIPVAPVF